MKRTTLTAGIAAIGVLSLAAVIRSISGKEGETIHASAGSHAVDPAGVGATNQHWNVEPIVAIHWDENTGVPYSKVPGMNMGAVAFAMVGEDKVAMLCNGVAEVRVFSTADGSLSHKFSVGFAPRDFAFDGGSYFVLFDRHVSIHSADGVETGTIALPGDAMGVTRLAVLDGAVHLWLPTGNSAMVHGNGAAPREELNGWVCPNGDLVFTAVVDGKAEATWYHDGTKSARAFAMDRKVAGVFPVGITGNKVVLDVQTFLSENPVEVERHYVAVDMGPGGEGVPLSMLKAPDCYYVYADRDIYQSSDGTLYNMVASPNGIHVFHVAECDEGPCGDYPADLRGLKYHYNHHLVKVD